MFWEAMTKTIFKSKMTIPVLMSFTVAILFVLATPPAFASHSVTLSPSSSQTGPVGVTQTYIANIQGVSGWQVDNTQGCVFPALDVVGPFLQISSAPPSFTNYYIISDTPGTYTCNYSITNGFGRGSHPFVFSITATFLPLPPPVMCGPGTILNNENKCVPDPAQQIMCGPGTILNNENKCVPDFANICGPGTVPNEENTQCIPEPIPNNPPDCSQAVASPNILWPPNHKMKDVSVEAVTDTDGDLVTLSVILITQDEPTNGLGDGDVSPDGAGVGTDSPQVRSERSGLGDGRVYVISFVADDGNGGTCQGSVSVSVPHDNSADATDSGQNFDSTIP